MFYLDVKFPIGFRVKAEYREQFSGTLKSLLQEVVKDLEEGSNKHYSYFLRERLSKKEKKVLIVLLNESLDQHSTKVRLSTESSIASTDTDDYIENVLERYTQGGTNVSL